MPHAPSLPYLMLFLRGRDGGLCSSTFHYAFDRKYPTQYLHVWTGIYFSNVSIRNCNGLLKDYRNLLFYSTVDCVLWTGSIFCFVVTFCAIKQWNSSQGVVWNNATYWSKLPDRAFTDDCRNCYCKNRDRLRQDLFHHHRFGMS